MKNAIYVAKSKRARGNKRWVSDLNEINSSQQRLYPMQHFIKVHPGESFNCTPSWSIDRKNHVIQETTITQIAILRTLDKNMSPFQIIKAENTIIAKFKSWNSNWRLFAQSFFSSITCLSIISFIIVAAVIVVVYMWNRTWFQAANVSFSVSVSSKTLLNSWTASFGVVACNAFNDIAGDDSSDLTLASLLLLLLLSWLLLGPVLVVVCHVSFHVVKTEDVDWSESKSASVVAPQSNESEICIFNCHGPWHTTSSQRDWTLFLITSCCCIVERKETTLKYQR